MKKLAFDSRRVAGFSPSGHEDTYVSRMLVDRTSVGSTRMVVNHFTLKPGKQTEAGSHPTPYDELYYVLRGKGVLYLGDPPEATEIRPDFVAFIPAGTNHALDNTGTDDLELITMMPAELKKGGNPLYDARKKEWGTSFRMADNGCSGDDG